MKIDLGKLGFRVKKQSPRPSYVPPQGFETDFEFLGVTIHGEWFGNLTPETLAMRLGTTIEVIEEESRGEYGFYVVTENGERKFVKKLNEEEARELVKKWVAEGRRIFKVGFGVGSVTGERMGAVVTALG